MRQMFPAMRTKNNMQSVPILTEPIINLVIAIYTFVTQHTNDPFSFHRIYSYIHNEPKAGTLMLPALPGGS